MRYCDSWTDLVGRAIPKGPVAIGDSPVFLGSLRGSFSQYVLNQRGWYDHHERLIWSTSLAVC